MKLKRVGNHRPHGSVFAWGLLLMCRVLWESSLKPEVPVIIFSGLELAARRINLDSDSFGGLLGYTEEILKRP